MASSSGGVGILISIRAAMHADATWKQAHATEYARLTELTSTTSTADDSRSASPEPEVRVGARTVPRQRKRWWQELVR